MTKILSSTVVVVVEHRNKMCNKAGEKLVRLESSRIKI
jgi:hypothetical protein